MLLTMKEAAALLERRRGARVHESTVRRWGRAGWFKLLWVNGLKVNTQEFTEWAARAGRLKRPTP